MIVLADVGTLAPDVRERLTAWVDNGGVLVRFAGPRLAGAGDDLVPVRLRRGGRTLGGSLTWEQPQHLSAFSPQGPFAGLAVPNDVVVSRQVLAEPDASLPERSWASLRDGTPLVTGVRRGKGVVALFHVGATRAGRTCRCREPLSRCCVGWSTCPATPRHSGRASPPRATRGAAAAAQPRRLRRLGPAALNAAPLPADYRDRATPEHPPGLYGPADAPLAVNALAAADRSRRSTICPSSAAGDLSRASSRGPARHPADVVAGAVPDRRHHRRDARVGLAALLRRRRTAALMTR